MSSFNCEKCNTPIIDTPGKGYITHCEHYPKENYPLYNKITEGRDENEKVGNEYLEQNINYFQVSKFTHCLKCHSQVATDSFIEHSNKCPYEVETCRFNPCDLVKPKEYDLVDNHIDNEKEEDLEVMRKKDECLHTSTHCVEHYTIHCDKCNAEITD